eukprot:5952613-Prymnesium_polylepis.2
MDVAWTSAGSDRSASVGCGRQDLLACRGDRGARRTALDRASDGRGDSTGEMQLPKRGHAHLHVGVRPDDRWELLALVPI